MDEQMHTHTQTDLVFNTRAAQKPGQHIKPVLLCEDSPRSPLFDVKAHMMEQESQLWAIVFQLNHSITVKNYYTLQFTVLQNKTENWS